MGSNFKSAVLEEQTVHAIKQWHAEVKKKRKKQANASKSTNYYNDSSSTTRSIGTNSTSTSDFSSHRRMPTLADFASGAGDEIVEEQLHHQEQEIVHQNDDERTIVEVSEVSPSYNGDVQIQIPELSTLHN